MQTKKVALVTGANKGIGFEITRQLAGHGFTVIIAGRQQTRVDEAVSRLCGEGLDVHGVKLDLTDTATIAAAAQWIDQQFGRLDVLINNAGISFEFGEQTRPSGFEMQTFKATYETNVFGTFAVTQAMLPQLRKSAPSRIVNQSSSMGSLGKMSDPATPYYDNNILGYNSSKSAVNGITVALAKDLAGEGVTVNSVCPGWVKTDLGGETAPRTVDQGAAIAVKLATMDNPPTGKFLDDAGEIPW